MNKCVIAVGTKNRPKLNACHSVLNHLSGKLFPGSEYRMLSRQTSSGVPAMPLSLQDMMHGAKTRAENVFDQISKEFSSPHYAIGLEGGFFICNMPGSPNPVPFLQSWVYVYDGQEGNWGSSGAIPVPWKVAKLVIEDHEELALVIDQVAGGKDIRSGVGAVGIFTDGEVAREEFFRQALIFAFAPFYNKNFYKN